MVSYSQDDSEPGPAVAVVPVKVGKSRLLIPEPAATPRVLELLRRIDRGEVEHGEVIPGDLSNELRAALMHPQTFTL